MKIIVVGAGVGGLCAAYWLQKQGHEIDVIEKDARLRTSGFPINIVGSAVEILRRMMLASEVDENRIHVDWLSLMDWRGRVVRRDDVSTFNSAEKMGVFILRPELLRLLLKSIEGNVNMRYSSELVQIRQDERRVEACFVDGSRKTYDLLIGADGVNSFCRRRLFPASNSILRSDVVYAAFTTRNVLNVPIEGFSMTGPRRSFGYTGLSAERMSALAWFRPSTESKNRSADTKAILLEEFGRFKNASEIIGSANCEDIFSDNLCQVMADRWSEGRCVLLGDAAYCSSPISARGAGLAIIGGYLLAQAIDDSGCHREAFYSFERKLRPGVEHVQELARRNMSMLLPGNRLSARLRNIVMKRISKKTWGSMMLKHYSDLPVDSVVHDKL